MPIEVFNRYEYKYIIDQKTFEKITDALDLHMVADKYCKNHSLYTIANLYCDTPDDALIRRSLNKLRVHLTRFSRNSPTPTLCPKSKQRSLALFMSLHMIFP